MTDPRPVFSLDNATKGPDGAYYLPPDKLELQDRARIAAFNHLTNLINDLEQQRQAGNRVESSGFLSRSHMRMHPNTWSTNIASIEVLVELRDQLATTLPGYVSPQEYAEAKDKFDNEVYEWHERQNRV